MTMSSVDARVGARVKNLRQKSGVNLAVAARRLAMSTHDYALREVGGARFTAAEIKAICGLLDVSPDAIYAGFISTPQERALKIH